MLYELITPENIQFLKNVSNWEEAIRQSAKPLLENKTIEPSYVDAIIKNAKELGPYIVIGPEIAIPHARPEAGVNKVGMSVLKLEEPVDFSNDQQERPVTLLFCLAATDSTSHLEALSELTQLLVNEDTFNQLKNSTTVEQVRELLASTSNIQHV